MAATIDRRDGVNPKRGRSQYGDVEIADRVNNTYPIDSPGPVLAAWSHINHKGNAAKRQVRWG